MILENKRKICVVVFSRANYGRIKFVLKAIQEHPNLELQLIVGASALLWRYGNVSEIIEADGFTVNRKAYCIVEGEIPIAMAKSTGLAIIELATAFEDLEPDIVFAIGDRYETLATATAASYMNIPVAHAQGGEVTGSIDESVRHAVSKLSHIHFAATEKSKLRLIKMGETPDSVHFVGCPSIDLVASCNLSLDALTNFDKGVGGPIDFNKKYLLVIQHPVTTEYGSGKKQIEETLKAIEKLNMQTIWLWPNIDAGSDDISKVLRVYRENKRCDFINLFRNFSAENYAILLNNAACAVGNSSSFLREAAYLGTPVVNIGSRQSGRERGKNSIDVQFNSDEIYQAISYQLKRERYSSDLKFGTGSSGKIIAELLSTQNVNVQKKIAY